jgi:hypothetical protein
MKTLSRMSTLLATTVMSLSTVCMAQTGASLITAPFEEGTKVEVQFNGQWQGDGHIEGTNTDVTLHLYDGQARAQLTSDELGLTFGAAVTAIDIAGSGALLDSLMDQSYALGFNVGKVGDWKVSAVLGAGYNGRSPYGDANALYGKADLIFATKPTDKTMWQVIIDYDGNRSFMPDVPLPSVSYSDWSNDAFTWTLGFPYSSFTWHPTDKCALEVGAVLIYDIHVTTTYELSDSLEFFAGYTSRTDAFRVDNDSPSARRLIFSQQTVELGVSYEPCKEFELTVAGGYAFDQKFDYGFDSRTDNTVADVSDEPYLRVAAEMKF